MFDKKEFQQVIGKIRKDRGLTSNGHNYNYPKPMLTGQQAAKNTATVNCGGEWYSADATMKLAEMVMNDSRFISLIKKYNATAKIEPNPFGGYQVRIDY